MTASSTLQAQQNGVPVSRTIQYGNFAGPSHPDVVRRHPNFVDLRVHAPRTMPPNEIMMDATTSYNVRPLSAQPLFPKQAEYVTMVGKDTKETKRQVYIHRQNSFIDVSTINHCDHSMQNTSPPSDDLREMRSNDDVDAALALVAMT